MNMENLLESCSILSGWMSFAAMYLLAVRIPYICTCSILSGWMSFAAEQKAAIRRKSRNLQYPQRMDELCSRRASCQPDVEQRLQYPQRMDELCSARYKISDGQPVRVLQYPQRMDELCSGVLSVRSKAPAASCSILSGWMSFAATELF